MGPSFFNFTSVVRDVQMSKKQHKPNLAFGLHFNWSSIHFLYNNVFLFLCQMIQMRTWRSPPLAGMIQAGVWQCSRRAWIRCQFRDYRCQWNRSREERDHPMKRSRGLRWGSVYKALRSLLNYCKMNHPETSSLPAINLVRLGWISWMLFTEIFSWADWF